jgi:hypothetical protein
MRGALQFIPRFVRFVACPALGGCPFVTLYPLPHIMRGGDDQATIPQRETTMKNSIISAVLAIATLGTTIAAHAQGPADQSVAVPAQRSNYALGVSEFTEYANSYALTNGQVATFTQRGNHYFVQLKSSLRSQQRDDSNGLRPATIRLRPVGPGAFVTDSGAHMTFRDHGEEVTINNFERLPEARVAVNDLNVQMIARR